MIRSSRQSKIIDIITKSEIDTQEELVTCLKEAGFNVTQATVSRDIKELGLFKISGEKKKYRYAIVENDIKGVSNKTNEIFKNVVLNLITIANQIVVKTVRGTAGFVNYVIDKLAIPTVIGIVYGDDTVLIITESEENAKMVEGKLKQELQLN